MSEEEVEYNVEKKESIYETLKKIKLTGFLKKKGKFDYLPWADAVAAIKKYYPESFTFEVVKSEDGFPYFVNELGCFVFVKVTIEGITHEQYLPVLDHNNHPMKLSPYTIRENRWNDKKKCKEMTDINIKAIDVLEINNTIQRCLVKCLAWFGLGLDVYRGEI